MALKEPRGLFVTIRANDGIRRHVCSGYAQRRIRKLWQLAGLVANRLKRRTRMDAARLDEYAEDAPAYLWTCNA